MLLFDENKRFYKGNLHLHTRNSDGRVTYKKAIAMFQAKGYDFLAITDHWKRTVDAEMAGDMLILPGIELDYAAPCQAIHIVGIGMGAEIEQEKEYRHLGVQHGIDAIRNGGGRAILAHPAWSLNTPETILSLRDITAAEIYNTVSGTPWNGDRCDSMTILDMVAMRGRLLNTVAADDCHFYNGDQCQAYIMAQLDELSVEGVLNALDKGAFYATQQPRIEQVEYSDGIVTVTCSPVAQALFQSNMFYAEGRCVEGDGMTKITYTVKRGERFLRIRLRDADGKCAWVNPISLV